MLAIDTANCPTPTRPDDAELADLTQRLESTRGTGWERWRLLAEGAMRDEHLAAARELARTHPPKSLDTVVVLGIGGSALGAAALDAAVRGAGHSLLPAPLRCGPRLLVLDNADPVLVGRTLAMISYEDPGLERTLFLVVSKSGETAETAAQFLIVRDLLARTLGARHADRLVAVTDPAGGTMRRICDAAGYHTLPVPEGVGGRFSVLSCVGLAPAAVCGLDIEALLDGAREMESACRSPEAASNPAAALARVLVGLGVGGAHAGGAAPRPVHVMMPYANQLYPLADWWRQLWAESLGKTHPSSGRGVGFTPAKALGATDQHSQVQLYREGPDDKVIILLALEHFAERCPIPAGLNEDALRYLEGSSLADLLDAERRATAYALTQSGRPNLTITLPAADERHAGQFFMLWQIATAYAGLMLGVDAYDQPAVELGKRATFALMGRPGHEQLRARLLGQASA